MSILTEIHDAVFKGSEEFYNAHIKKEKLNTTMEGLIKTVLGNNQYTVTMNMIDYTIPGTEMPVSSYVVGDIVNILIPNQNFSRKYISCKRPPY